MNINKQNNFANKKEIQVDKKQGDVYVWGRRQGKGWQLITIRLYSLYYKEISSLLLETKNVTDVPHLPLDSWNAESYKVWLISVVNNHSPTTSIPQTREGEKPKVWREEKVSCTWDFMYSRYKMKGRVSWIMSQRGEKLDHTIYGCLDPLIGSLCQYPLEYVDYIPCRRPRTSLTPKKKLSWVWYSTASCGSWSLVESRVTL